MMLQYPSSVFFFVDEKKGEEEDEGNVNGRWRFGLKKLMRGTAWPRHEVKSFKLGFSWFYLRTR